MSIALASKNYISGVRLITPKSATDPPLFNFLKNVDSALTNLNQTQSNVQTVNSVIINGGQITQDVPPLAGGYLVFVPISYNPYDSPTPVYDNWGNPVQQPLPIPNSPPFGPNDLVLWNSLSPSMKFQGGTGVGLIQDVYITGLPTQTNTGPNGIPLAVNENYGLNTNGYLFGRGGLATDNPYYNSIESLQGGVTASMLYSSTLYPTGTITTTGTLTAPTYLGGYICTGHSIGAPAAGNIGTVTNPLIPGFGLVQGIIYFDDGTNFLTYYDGISWVGVLGTISIGLDKDVLFNKSGKAFANNNFYYDYTYSQLYIIDLNVVGNASGIIAPYFNGSVTRLSNTPIYTFGNSDGSWSADYQGNLSAQTYRSTTVFNSLADITGSPSTTAAFQTSGGNVAIYGNGYANFQTLALALLGGAITGISGGTGVGNALLSATTTGLYLSLNGAAPILLTASIYGSINQVLYNDGSAVVGSSGLIYNGAILYVGGISPVSGTGIIAYTFNATTTALTDASFQSPNCYIYGSGDITTNGTLQLSSTSTPLTASTGKAQIFVDVSNNLAISVNNAYSVMTLNANGDIITIGGGAILAGGNVACGIGYVFAVETSPGIYASGYTGTVASAAARSIIGGIIY